MSSTLLKSLFSVWAEVVYWTMIGLNSDLAEKLSPFGR